MLLSPRRVGPAAQSEASKKKGQGPKKPPGRAKPGSATAKANWQDEEPYGQANWVRASDPANSMVTLFPILSRLL